MTKLKSLERTAVVAFGCSVQPFIAVATAAGVVDTLFASSAQLELFDLDLTDSFLAMRPAGSVAMSSKLNRVAWGTGRSQGIVAGGSEHGELLLWDASAVVKSSEHALMASKNAHKGAVKGLDFNAVQPNTIATGASDGEVLVWDISRLDSEPTVMGRSQRVEAVTHLQWNSGLPHILAAASSSGSAVVYDTRSIKELTTLTYPGGRKALVCVAWNSADQMYLATAADDDFDPVVLVWDLRNAATPVSQLRGHGKAVTSIAWNPRDSGLLATCSKDTRTKVWNTTSSAAIGDLHMSGDWASEVYWCDRNPDLAVIASLDGTVTIHSLHGASPAHEDASNCSPRSATPDDDFSLAVLRGNAANRNAAHLPFKLHSPPSWFKRPCSVSWAFGGRLVTVTKESRVSTVTARTVADSTLFERMQALRQIIAYSSPEVIAEYCKLKAISASEDKQTWDFMQVLIAPGAASIAHFIGSAQDTTLFKKLNIGTDKIMDDILLVPAHLASDSLIVENPDAAIESYNSIAQVDRFRGCIPPVVALPLRMLGSTSNDKTDAEVDVAIARCVVLGDFESAVKLCLATDRAADALMLAMQGDDELLSRTRSAYFTREASKKAYIRLLQGVAYEQVAQTVEHIDVSEAGAWKEAMSYLYTFAPHRDISDALSRFGSKLEAACKLSQSKELARDQRQGALFCHLGAGDLSSIVDIWCPTLLSSVSKKSCADAYSISLQTFIEKILVFRLATAYEDHELFVEPLDRYTLEPLYERFVEYMVLAADQGAVDISAVFSKLIPQHFVSQKQTLETLPAITRNRILYSGQAQPDPNYPAEFPFEILDVIDIEVRKAEERAREEAVRASERMIQQQQQQQAALQQRNSVQMNSYQQIKQSQYGQYQQQTGQQNTQPAYQQPSVPTMTNAYHQYSTQPNAIPYNHQNTPTASTQPPPQIGFPVFSSAYQQPNAPNVPLKNNMYQSTPPSTYQQPSAPPLGNTYQQPSAPPLGSTYQQPSAPPLGSTYQQPSAPPLGYTYQQPSAPPLGSTYQQPSAPAMTNAYQQSYQPIVPQKGTFQSGIAPTNMLPPPPTNMYSHGTPPYVPQKPISDLQSQSAINKSGLPPQGIDLPKSHFVTQSSTPGNMQPPSMYAPPATSYKTNMPVNAYSQPPHGHDAKVMEHAQAYPSNVSPHSVDGYTANNNAEKINESGDRSKLNLTQRACLESIDRVVTSLVQASTTGPPQRRVLEEAENKFKLLGDQMAAGKLDADVFDKLLAFVKQIEVLNFAQARKIHLELITTRFEATGLWIVGLKQLLDSAERCQNMKTGNTPQRPPTISSNQVPQSSGRVLPNADNRFVAPYSTALPPAQVQGLGIQANLQYNQHSNPIAQPPTNQTYAGGHFGHR